MYRESLTLERCISFLLIWCAIGLYAYSLRQLRQRQAEITDTAA